MATTDGRDPRGDTQRGYGGDAEWAMSADPADDWILDPHTGEYRMRLPGERLQPPAPARAAAPSTGAELELRSTREMEIVRLPDRTPARTAPAPAAGGRAAGRAAERGSRRAGGGGRRRTGGGRGTGGGNGGFSVVIALGAVGVIGCAFGGYLLFSGGGGPAAKTACTAAAPAPTPAAPAPSPSDGGPAVTPGPHAIPINVRVSIYDGSGKIGLAGAVLTWMQNKQGYLRTSNEGPAPLRATTSLVYEPPHADQARTLAAALHLPSEDIHGTAKGDGLRDPMILTLGKDFTAAGQAPSVPPTPTPAAVRPSCVPAS